MRVSEDSRKRHQQALAWAGEYGLGLDLAPWEAQLFLSGAKMRSRRDPERPSYVWWEVCYEGKWLGAAFTTLVDDVATCGGYPGFLSMEDEDEARAWLVGHCQFGARITPRSFRCVAGCTDG